MIVFDLDCERGHRFEGWFQSAEAFGAQCKNGLVSCPVCASTEIRRVPSAIHFATASEESPTPTPTLPANTAVIHPEGRQRDAYRKLAAIIASSEDVGKEFANEARKIHYLETPRRSIRGQASPEEFEALRDEGIDVLRLAVMSKEDMN